LNDLILSTPFYCLTHTKVSNYLLARPLPCLFQQNFAGRLIARALLLQSQPALT
jgi:hypothetical protein